jgi:hypothetical protein
VADSVAKLLRTGPTSKVAVTYFEWSASSGQKIIITWRVIDGPESADAVAAEIMKTPVRVVTIKDRDKFKEAIRTKLIVEVAGRTPDAGASRSPRKSRGCPV